MSKLNILGGLSCLVGLVILGFQAISTLMDPKAADIYQTETQWKTYAMVDLLDEQYFDWIGDLTWGPGAMAAERLVTTPIYILFLALGILCFIINFFMPKV